MEKLKSILRPGHDKDDEVLYGKGEGQHSSSTHHTGTEGSIGHDESNAAGVRHQLTNPGGDKYNETSYGPAGSHTAAEQLPQSVSGDQHLYTDPTAQKKEHGVLRQILNPGGDKYDETRYGTTATTTPPTGVQTHGDHGVSHHTEQTGGTSSQPLTGSSTTETGASSGGLSHHVHNQVTGTSSSHSRAANAAATGTTTRHLDHDHNRDTALAGGAAGAAGGLAATHEARKHHDEGAAGGLSHHVHNYLYEGPAGGSHSSATSNTHTPPRPVMGDASSVASIKSGVVGRDPDVHAPSGMPTGAAASTSSASATGGALPAVPNTGGKFLDDQSGGYSSSNTGDRSFPLSGAGTSSTLPDRSVGHNTAGGNHGREGLAAAAGAATASTYITESTQHKHSGHGHEYLGANIDETTPTGGPHATLMANKLDPSVSRSGATGSGITGSGLSSSNTTGSEHHHGRDAALAGGVGAGAAGAYAVGRNAGTDTGPAPNTIGPHDKDWKNVLDPRVRPEPSLQKSAGPDATGPASNTIGPHDKDWKNVVDPRVQPDPALQKSASTTSNTGPAANTIGSHDKDWKNVLDPRVQPNPAAQKGGHTAAAATGVAHPTDHQARDAGLIAGGGALGAAGAAGLGHHSSSAASGTTGTTGSTFGSSAAPGTAVTTSGQHATPASGLSTTGTSHEHQHHGTRDVAAAGGAGAAGIAASRAFNKHEHPPVVGETGRSSMEANPYSSQGLDPRVDGNHPRHTSGTTGLSSSTTTSTTTTTDTKHHFGRDAAITGASLGASGVGAHELSKHHGEQVGHESLGAHDPSTHHGIGSTTGTSGTTSHATHSAIPGSGVSTDRAAHNYPAPGDKLDQARTDVAHQAHEEHEAGGEKKGFGDKIKGMLHLGGSSSTSNSGAHKDEHPTSMSEEQLQPHLHHDDRNRLHKEPKHGYPSASTEGTTIGTGSGITAATVPASEGGATTTGQQMGS